VIRLDTHQNPDDDLPSIKELPRPKRAPDTRMITETTVYHMGVYDLEDARRVRQLVIELSLKSKTSPEALISCFDALRELWIILRPAMSEGVRKSIDEQINSFQKECDKLEDLPRDKTIPSEQYRNIRERMRNLIAKVYIVKQVAGLGIPKTRLMDSEALMNEAMK